MKIEQFGGGGNFYTERREVLRALIDDTKQSDGRPCPGCEMRCPSCGSTTCLCNCRPDCPQAPLALSSDPEKFPIEEGIVPLVFALNDLAIGSPCWSCEGHPSLDESPGKLPQVWFYVRHLVYPDLLARYLWKLHFRGLIGNPWKVAVVSTDNAVDTTFAIAPAPSDGATDLASLRRDIRIIGERMSKDIGEIARDSMAEIENAICRTD